MIRSERTVGMIEKTTIMNHALSSPQRMRIMKVLGSAEINTRSVSDVANILGISQSTVTKHLQVLYRAGFVKRKKVASTVYYSADAEGLAEYRKLIDCAFIAQQTDCVNNWECDNCPEKVNCNTDFQF